MALKGAAPDKRSTAGLTEIGVAVMPFRRPEPIGQRRAARPIDPPPPPGLQVGRMVVP
jgi:hypothetical protein